MNGQRVNLREIEHHTATSQALRRPVALVPRPFRMQIKTEGTSGQIHQLCRLLKIRDPVYRLTAGQVRRWVERMAGEMQHILYPLCPERGERSRG